MVKKQGNQEPLEERVLGFIDKHNLLAGQSRLVAGISGGPDSVCLFHILVKIQVKLGFKLYVAHLDHRLRGADSEADAQYVRQLANDVDIPVVIEQSYVREYQERQHIPLEEAAREVRYSFFSQVAESIGASRVAVGHTADDQVETILMHLVRGTGTRGLRGLQPCTLFQFPEYSITIIRPLLDITRQEVLDYCRYYQLKPRLDTTNLSLSPLRNRLRHQLIPLLQSYNPRVNEAILRMAEITGDDLSFLDRERNRLWDRVTEKDNDTITFDKEAFLDLPLSMQRIILRTAIENLLGNIRDIEARHIEEIIDVLDKPAGKRLVLPRGIVFSIEYDHYLLGKNTTNPSPFPSLKNEYILNIPGETALPGWKVTADIINGEQIIENKYCAFFDIEKTGREIKVRSRREGDRFQPLGMIYSKKLGEFMIDAKIPNAWRDNIPIVCSSQHIIWVVGWRIDDRVKVTSNTNKVLRLEFERTTDP